MKIVRIDGGLGNQVFQYIFARYIEEQTGEKVYLDDLYFRINIRGEGVKTVHPINYEMEDIFGVKANLLSEYFSKDVWNYMMNSVDEKPWEVTGERMGDTCQQLYNNGLDIYMVYETNNYIFNGKTLFLPTNTFTPDVGRRFTGDVYFHGYWINKWYFESIKDVLMEELKFPPLKDEYNIKYAEMINTTNSVGIHFRRQNFVTIGIGLRSSYYYNAMKEVAGLLPDATYFIFSDDIEWCKDNYEALGFNFAKENIVFVEGNHTESLEYNKNHYVDMQLMTMCKHMIMSNSSYCYLAVILNKHRGNGMLIINPTSREV